MPGNVLVDYDEERGKFSNFKCYLADWGTAGGDHLGGTPVYAGPRTYESNGDKDLFSFCRLALELFLEKKGKVKNSKVYQFQFFFDFK